MTTPCKRLWEGQVGITLYPQEKKDGDYFWTFRFVRSFKRQGSEKWEYVEYFGQNHSEALGKLMTKAFRYMEEQDPTQFVIAWMTAQEESGNESTASMRNAAHAGIVGNPLM